MEPIALVLTFILAGAGAYLGSYLKKKGENLATQEDVDKLVSQMKAVTQATKDIEAKISTDVWDRQKRWELKRDALFDAVKELGGLETIVSTTISAYKLVHNANDDVVLDAKRLAIESYTDYQVFQRDFNRAMSLAVLVSGPEVVDQFNTAKDVILKMVQFAMHHDVEVPNDMLEKFVDAIYEVRMAVRRELDIK